MKNFICHIEKRIIFEMQTYFNEFLFRFFNDIINTGQAYGCKYRDFSIIIEYVCGDLPYFILNIMQTYSVEQITKRANAVKRFNFLLLEFRDIYSKEDYKILNEFLDKEVEDFFSMVNQNKLDRLTDGE